MPPLSGIARRCGAVAFLAGPLCPIGESNLMAMEASSTSAHVVLPDGVDGRDGGEQGATARSPSSPPP